MVVLLFLLTVLLGVGAISAGITYVQSGLRSVKKELQVERHRSAVFGKALRQISAGAEMPVFVASNAIDEIDNYNDSKELT